MSQPLTFLMAHLTLRMWFSALKNRSIATLPHGLYTAVQYQRMKRKQWWRNSAIHPDFVQRLHLLEQLLDDPSRQPASSPREVRHRFMAPGSSIVGAIHAELGRANGLDVRDPTADARLLQFTFSVPDRIFMDPETGIDRWLIREAMKGRLPDEVRLNRRRGRQAGDLIPRLRNCSDEVEASLDELATGPAATYVDVQYMRQVWRMVQTDNTTEAFLKSVTVLTRGIMAGLFVNNFYGQRSL